MHLHKRCDKRIYSSPAYSLSRKQVSKRKTARHSEPRSANTRRSGCINIRQGLMRRRRSYLSQVRGSRSSGRAAGPPGVLLTPNEIHDKSSTRGPANMPGNSMLGSTYLSPLKTRVISHNVKTIISKKRKYSAAVDGGRQLLHTQKRAAENEGRKNRGPRSTEEDKL